MWCISDLLINATLSQKFLTHSISSTLKMSGYLIYFVLNSFSSAFFSLVLNVKYYARTFESIFYSKLIELFLFLELTSCFHQFQRLISPLSFSEDEVPFYRFSMDLPAYLIRYSAECLFGLDRYTTQVYWLCYM